MNPKNRIKRDFPTRVKVHGSENFSQDGAKERRFWFSRRHVYSAVVARREKDGSYKIYVYIVAGYIHAAASSYYRIY